MDTKRLDPIQKLSFSAPCGHVFANCYRLNNVFLLQTILRPTVLLNGEIRSPNIPLRPRCVQWWAWDQWLPLAISALGDKIISTNSVSHFFLSHGYNIIPIEIMEYTSWEEETSSLWQQKEAVVQNRKDDELFARVSIASP